MVEDCNLQKGRQTPKPGSITVYHGSNPPQCNKGRSLTAVPAGWPLLVWLQLNFLLDPFNWRQWWNAHCTVDSEISQAHRSMSLLRTAASTQRTLTDSQASLKSDAKSKVTMRVKRRKDESSCKMVRCSPSATQKPTLWPHLSVQYFNRGNPRTRHPCEVSRLNSCKHRQLWSTEEKWLEDKHRGSRSFPHGVCKLLNVGGARVLAWTGWLLKKQFTWLCDEQPGSALHRGSSEPLRPVMSTPTYLFVKPREQDFPVPQYSPQGIYCFSSHQQGRVKTNSEKWVPKRTLSTV